MCLPLITVDDTVFSQQSAQSSFQWYDSLLLLCERFLLVLATNIIPCYLGTYERAHSRRCFGRWREALCTIPLTFSPEADEISVETRGPIIVLLAHRLEQVVGDTANVTLQNARCPLDVAHKGHHPLARSIGAGHRGRQDALVCFDDDFVVGFEGQSFMPLVYTGCA